MASRQKGTAVEDLRFFVNPFVSDPACKEPNKADGKLSPELISKLQSSISINTVAIDSAYLSRPSRDYSVYTGSTGIAFLHYHLAKTLHKDDPVPDLLQAEQFLQSALQNLDSRRHTFLCGASGPLAVGALVYWELDKGTQSKHCIDSLRELFSMAQPDFSKQPSELLYGHTGLLYSLLLVNKNLPGTFDEEIIAKLVDSVLSSGERGREAEYHSPLMFTWHNRHYLGAAHGIAGILTMLLQVPMESLKQRILCAVRPCVDFLLSVCFKSGNLPSSLESSKNDVLVHWCHGAPGAVYLFSHAYQVFREQAYLDAALACGEVVWKRGLLRKGYGLCHGVAGNAYTFIQLYRATGHKHHLQRTIRFAEWCLTADERVTRVPDTPHSLFEGLAGTTFFFVDMLTNLQSANFPAFEL